MGSSVKWVFYTLFGTTSIVKLFHSFEYREIPGYNSLWRCPLYSSTIFKSRILLSTVLIFALPNKSPPFRLSHFASEKLLNVHVLHFLDKQCFPEFVLLIIVLNDREKKVCFLENFHLQTKNIHNFFEDNTRCTPGRKSKHGLERLKKWVFAWKLKKFKFRKEKGMTPHWPPVPTSRGTKINQKHIVGVENAKTFQISYLIRHCVVTKPNSLVDVAPGLKSRRSAFEAKYKHVFFATKNFLMIVFPKINGLTWSRNIYVHGTFQDSNQRTTFREKSPLLSIELC